MVASQHRRLAGRGTTPDRASGAGRRLLPLRMIVMVILFTLTVSVASACSDGCKECNAEEQCTQCADGYYPHPRDTQGLSNANLGDEADSGVLSANTNTSEVTGSVTSEPTQPPTTSGPADNSTGEEVTTPSSKPTVNCSPCPDHCLNCTSDQCTVCKEDYELSPDGQCRQEGEEEEGGPCSGAMLPVCIAVPIAAVVLVVIIVIVVILLVRRNRSQPEDSQHQPGRRPTVGVLPSLTELTQMEIGLDQGERPSDSTGKNEGDMTSERPSSRAHYTGDPTKPRPPVSPSAHKQIADEVYEQYEYDTLDGTAPRFPKTRQAQENNNHDSDYENHAFHQTEEPVVQKTENYENEEVIEQIRRDKQKTARKVQHNVTVPPPPPAAHGSTTAHHYVNVNGETAGNAGQTTSDYVNVNDSVNCEEPAPPKPHKIRGSGGGYARANPTDYVNVRSVDDGGIVRPAYRTPSEERKTKVITVCDPNLEEEQAMQQYLAG